MKKTSVLFVGLAVIFLIVGVCHTGAADNGPIKIGMLHWEKYPHADMMKKSHDMALSEINKGGGINGRPLELVYANDWGKPDKGEKAVKHLVKREGVVLLTGGYSSGNTLAMAKTANDLDRPLLVCTAADDRITQRDLENVFRMNPPVKEYTAGLENFFLDQIKPKSMAIVYENSEFGTGGALRMMWFCRENGIDIVRIIPYHKERATATGPGYFTKMLFPLKETQPDVIFMVSYYEDGAALIKEIGNLKIKSLLCGGAGGFTHPGMGKVAENLVTATLWHHLAGYPGAEAYYNGYKQKHGQAPDYHGAEAYSALLVVADALKRAKSLTPEGIRNALGRTNMKTPFGPVAFFSYGNSERQNSLPTLVMQIIGGKFECIWPKETATKSFVSPAGWR